MTKDDFLAACLVWPVLVAAALFGVPWGFNAYIAPILACGRGGMGCPLSIVLVMFVLTPALAITAGIMFLRALVMRAADVGLAGFWVAAAAVSAAIFLYRLADWAYAGAHTLESLTPILFTGAPLAGVMAYLAIKD